MKKPLNFVLLLALTTLVGCNDDVGSRRPPKPGVVTPPVQTTTITQRSMIHRERAATVLTTADEIKKTLAGSLSVNSYRAIPLMEKDDEGSSKNTVTIQSIGRPSVTCGIGSFSGIKARIADCLAKNAERSSWQGKVYGASGEGDWNLVVKSADNKEIWIDVTTGMVWSYLITRPTNINTFNWCKASGNGQGVTSSETIDCLVQSGQVSLCEGEELEEVGKDVIWRLPTRNDYLQADLNGLRFVLQRESDLGLWTATMRSTTVGRTEAWVYSTKEGTLLAGNLTSERHVRCIGVPKL